MTDATFDYFDQVGRLARRAVVTGAAGTSMDIPAAVEWTVATARNACASGKIMFIGNGGSAAIASHMAIDFSKNGGLRATAFNDPATLTCLSNDLGFENVFSAQVEWHACAGDLLVAISSSGKSPNILKAVALARQKGCRVLTLSGFGADNPLRTLGDVNIYVPSASYGSVEITHLAICHCVLDTAMGLVRGGRSAAVSAA